MKKKRVHAFELPVGRVLGGKYVIDRLLGAGWEGELMEDFVARQPGKRLPPFEALHLFYTLVLGIEEVHGRNEYHGDIHDRNILVRRRGVGFDLTLLDLFHWGHTTRYRLREDMLQMVRVLYDAVGGRKRYASQPPEIKAIGRGLRHDLILRRFPTVLRLRKYLESFTWES